MRPTLVLAVLLALTAGCAASASEPRRLRPAAAMDDAVELAAMLPDSSDRCVVVRPGRVASRRRALLLFRSWARPETWSREWSVVAYAQAESQRPRARRSYLRFARRTDELEQHLRSLNVRWLDEECEGAQCRRPVARWVDERTLEVASHAWPRRERPVPSAACVRLAGAHPEAVEVAADRGASLGVVAVRTVPTWGVDPRPHRVHRLLYVDGDQLRSRRVLTFADEPSAVAWETLRRTTPELTPSLLPSDPNDQAIRRVNNRITVEERQRFEELELRLEDERLERRAYLHERERSEPRPVDEVDVQNLAVLRHQIGLWRVALQRLNGARRTAAAERLVALVARGWAAHPSREELPRAIAEIELGVLARPARAVAIADRVLAANLPVERERWTLLRRDALARFDTPSLARALAVDGVAPRAQASALAEDLAALREAGVEYELAEAAWVRGRSLAAPTARVPEGSIDLLGVVGALVLYSRASSSRGPGRLVHVTARWSGAVEARAIGQTRPELFVMRAGGDRAMAVGLAAGDLASLRALGSSLASVLPVGPVELVVEISGGSSPVRLALAGRREGQSLRVQRASTELAAIRLDALQRYLAEPLGQLPTSLFPPPELTIRAASAEEAAELRQAASVAAPQACRVAGPYLRCTSPGRPERLADLLVQVAASRDLRR